MITVIKIDDAGITDLAKSNQASFYNLVSNIKY